MVFINFIIINLINFKTIQKFRTQFKNLNLKEKRDAKFRDNLKSKIIKIKFIDLLFLNYNTTLCNKLSFKIALIALFFDFFMIFILAFLTSAINTDSLVVKTDDFLNQQYKLLNSSKKFVFDQGDKQIFSRSPKNAFLYKLYNKKVKYKILFLCILIYFFLFIKI